MDKPSRRAAWAAAPIATVLWVGLAGSPAAAAPPDTWPKPAPMSTLHALLFFVGIPTGLVVLIALLVMAPSVARGPRYRPGRSWLAEPEQFGAGDLPSREQPAIGSGLATADGRVGGGASARW